MFRTVMGITNHRNLEVEFRFEGGTERRMRQWLGTHPVYSKQREGDLGERMHTAFIEAFKNGYRRVVLLGTDIPGLTTDHLGKAFDVLKEKDLVLGPSPDGGYWLIGLRRPIDLFTGIHWGTQGVLEKTVQMAEKQGLKIRLIDSLTDIDTVEDLREWEPDWEGIGPYLSIIIPTLNEEKNIKATIQHARDEDAEIIVVDGGSRDNTVARARDAGVRVEISPRGRALQQNRGAALSRGRVLLFLHADTELPSGFVGHVFEILMDPGAAAGAFHFKTEIYHPLMKVVALMTNFRSRYLNLPYGDQGLFLRKEVFESVGGFPEVPIAEDLFLVKKLAKHGIIRFAPAHVLTSARRWQTLGIFRTTLTNIVIAAACHLGVSYRILKRLYNLPQKNP
jgi:rSAM/selenodomain-associated transferase 2/rSAM/selenodomain-associated transferase 1